MLADAGCLSCLKSSMTGFAGGSHAGGSLVPDPLGDAEPMLLPSQMYFRDLRSICHRGVGLREGAGLEESASLLLPMPLLILCGSGKAAAALQTPARSSVEWVGE